MKTQSKPELRAKISEQEIAIKTLTGTIKELKIENKRLIYAEHDTETRRRNCQFALEKVTEDRNRYAELYYAEAVKVQNLEKSVDSNELLVVKLSIGVAIIAGAAIFLGTIVACVGFSL